MKILSKHLLLLSLPTFILSTPLSADYTLVNGKLVNTKYQTQFSDVELFDKAHSAIRKENWQQAIMYLDTIRMNYPNSKVFEESLYLFGTAYFHMDEYAESIMYLNEYLNRTITGKHLEDVLNLKFMIAEELRRGKKLRLMKKKMLPKVSSGYEMALDAYNEIIMTIPGTDLAARSLWGKAQLLIDTKDYSGAIDALKLLTRRFPKGNLAPDAHLELVRIYYEQTKMQIHSPHIAMKARTELAAFTKKFPRHENTREMESYLNKIESILAKGLYQTAEYYSRKKLFTAARLYYNNTINEYPETLWAEKASQKLNYLPLSP